MAKISRLVRTIDHALNSTLRHIWRKSTPDVTQKKSKEEQSDDQSSESDSATTKRAAVIAASKIGQAPNLDIPAGVVKDVRLDLIEKAYIAGLYQIRQMQLDGDLELDAARQLGERFRKKYGEAAVMHLRAKFPEPPAR